jgi:hypothetical protein
MRRDNEDKINPRQPALIVLYGNTKRKHRPLDRDVIVLGRSPSCDLGLISPEVAPVHCVIVRFPHGWRIRDCSGRPGTCVNGRTIHDEALRDGDVIQVGSFSFQAHLPVLPPHAAPAAEQEAAVAQLVSPGELPEYKHLERSRRNLAEHALRLRRQLREGLAAQADLDNWRADLEQQEARVRALAREQEARARPPSDQAAAPSPVETQRREQELAHYAEHLKRWAGQLQAQQEELRRPAPQAAPSGTDAGREELLEQVRQRDQQIEELLALLEETKKTDDEERVAVEVELNRYRLELDRERALLAEERAALERLRAVTTPAANEGTSPAPSGDGVRNKLELVRKLRQELAERRQVLGKGPRSRQLRHAPSEPNTPAPAPASAPAPVEEHG